LDVLVNNAAYYEFRALDSIDEQHFRKQFDVNVLGLLFATQEAVKLRLSGGSVVNISSVAAITPVASRSVCIARQRPRLMFSLVCWPKNWDRARFE
jgi:3-oxoacyl-[acyl-carrier protein] reductase